MNNKEKVIEYFNNIKNLIKTEILVVNISYLSDFLKIKKDELILIIEDIYEIKLKKEDIIEILTKNLIK